MNAIKTILWGATAVAAVAVATAVVTVAVTNNDRAGVLSQEDVLRQLGEESAPPGGSATAPGPGGPATSAPVPGTGADEVLTSQAGTLVVGCTDKGAELRRWSPNAGYRADDVVRGPAAVVSVWFESDRDNDVKVIVRCTGGRPVLTEEVEFDDHGGDRSGHD